MSQRNKSLLDRIGTLVPGFDGYAKRDDQRRSDKLLRTQIAETLLKTVSYLEKYMKSLVREKKVSEFAEFEEIRKAYSTISDKILLASYGASSLFDAEQIKEDELREIYTMDEQLLDRSNHLYLIVQQEHEASLLMATMRSHLKEIDQLVSERSNFIRFKGKQ